MSGWGEYANAFEHRRYEQRVATRRRCWCGCKQRATHTGFANGIAMTCSTVRVGRTPMGQVRAGSRNPRAAPPHTTRQPVKEGICCDDHHDVDLRRVQRADQKQSLKRVGSVLKAGGEATQWRQAPPGTGAFLPRSLPALRRLIHGRTRAAPAARGSGNCAVMDALHRILAGQPSWGFPIESAPRDGTFVRVHRVGRSRPSPLWEDPMLAQWRAEPGVKGWRVPPRPSRGGERL